MPKKIKMYWCGKNAHVDDALNPLFLERIFGVQTIPEPDPLKAQLIGIGSVWNGDILNRQQEFTAPGLHVWGTGFYGGDVQCDSPYIMPHLVRGRLTASRFTGFAGKIGDARLLSGHLLDGPIAKQYAVGIIPHWQEQDNAIAQAVAASLPHGTVITMRQPPLEVIRQIAACDFVLSASLHGLVVADSLGIPNQWIALSNMTGEQAEKFRDYYTAYDINDPQPLALTTAFGMQDAQEIADSYARPGIGRIRQEVLGAFPVATVA